MPALSRYRDHEKKIWRRVRKRGREDNNSSTFSHSNTFSCFFYMHAKWVVGTHCKYYSVCVYDGKSLMKRPNHNSRRNSSCNSSYLASIFLEAWLFSLIEERESKEQYWCCHSHIILQFYFLCVYWHIHGLYCYLLLLMYIF